MIYFLKAMTNSFQTLISKVYFCEVYLAYASSKLCEFIVAEVLLKPSTVFGQLFVDFSSRKNLIKNISTSKENSNVRSALKVMSQN